jgi:hypothetical protein
MPTSSSSCHFQSTRELSRGEAARNCRIICAGTDVVSRGKRPSYDLSNWANAAKAPVPRHGEIDNRLARKISDQLGIPSIR